MDRRPKIYTIKEAAAEYGFTESALRRWIRQGDIPVFRAGTRYYLTDVIVEDFLATGAKTETPLDGLEPICLRKH
ncbi:MAG: helix-turn-helix domain-containing protein [Oscillospiraceae bacterium]|nr:helix-turn-helix domain-containing protein [Oscillospiraceae bacterium]